MPRRPKTSTLLLLAISTLFVSLHFAMDGVHFTGKVGSRPDGLIGEWRIGDRTVHVSEETTFDDEHGPFPKGACVEVEGTLRENGTVNAATMESRPEGDCGVEAEEIRFEGVVDALPGGEHIGEWEVGPHVVVVSGETNLNDEHGPFVVGACVVVEGLLVEGHVVAGGIATLPPGECGLPEDDDEGEEPEDDEGEPEPFEFTGLIEDLPGGNLRGEWRVGDRSVSVGEGTQLSPIEGPFVEGACVEVAGHERENGSVEAISIRTEDPEECGILGDDDEGDGEPEEEDDEGEEDHRISFKGLVESLPDGGLIGKWVVKGRMVFVDDSTEFDTEHGPLVIGACVEVSGVETADGVDALKIETESLRECGRSEGPDFGIAPNGIEFTGLVDKMPADGLFGEWIINGQTVLVSRSTELILEKGIEPGPCVEVRGSLSSSGDVRARRIASKSAGACLPGEALPKVKFEGPVQELPNGGLTGEWKVGGIVIHVSGETEVHQDRGPVTIGACIEVDGELELDNEISANEIEVVSSAAGCRHRKPDEVDEVSFLGVIQDLPDEGVVGEWRIAGRTVLVTSSTVLDLPGDPEVEMCVKVKGVRLPDDAVLANKITLAEFGACGGPPEPSELKLKGILHQLPDLGLIGAWLVGDYTVHVNGDTKLGDEQGPFMEGSCVRVLGRLQDDESVLARVAETEDPEECGIQEEQPDDGPFEFLGQVETAPKSKSAKGATGAWIIGKHVVNVSEATSLDQTAGALNLGSCVVVSGLPAAGGTFTATSISVRSSSGTCFEAEGLVNAASFASEPVSPGEIISIFGLAIGPPDDAGMIVEEGQVTTELADTRVLFDGVAAPLIYVSSSQLNAVVPYSVAGKATVNVQVEQGGAWSNIVTLGVAASAPGIFTITQIGSGQAAALNVESDGSLTVNNSANPIGRGGVVVLYATGEGQTNPPGTDGEIVDGVGSQPALPVTVTIGGVPAQVVYSGSAPGFVAGLLQVNAVVSEQVTPGSAVPVVITLGADPSQTGATIAVE